MRSAHPSLRTQPYVFVRWFVFLGRKWFFLLSESQDSGEIFVNRAPRAQEVIPRLNRWDFTKLKQFMYRKISISRAHSYSLFFTYFFGSFWGPTTMFPNKYTWRHILTHECLAYFLKLSFLPLPLGFPLSLFLYIISFLLNLWLAVWLALPFLLFGLSCVFSFYLLSLQTSPAYSFFCLAIDYSTLYYINKVF